MKKLIRKLKSQAGESLGETMIALLISILGVALLAMMINTSANLIKKGDDQFNNYIGKENKLVEKVEETNTLKGQVYITSANNSTNFYRVDNDITIVNSKYDVNYYKNELNNIEVISYKARWKEL